MRAHVGIITVSGAFANAKRRGCIGSHPRVPRSLALVIEADTTWGHEVTWRRLRRRVIPRTSSRKRSAPHPCPRPFVWLVSLWMCLHRAFCCVSARWGRVGEDSAWWGP